MGTTNNAHFCIAKQLGGGKRDRTDDLLHAMQALSQLSYTPQTCGADNLTEGLQSTSTALLHYANPGVPKGIRTPVLTVKG
jgi:hypothetical protein